MTQTDPYPSDSLRWVAAEVRFPPAPDFPTEAPLAFLDHVRGNFPILEEQTQVSFSVGSSGAPQQALQHRFVRRDRLMSVTIGRDALVLEATDYAGWTAFRDLFIGILHALEIARRPDGILRVGLRYIDEVRIPDDPPASLDAWIGWIDDRLVAPFQLYEPSRLANGTVLLQFGEAPGHVTIFRAAPFVTGRTVLPQGPLRMPVDTDDGPYFLLDTDASWADPSRQVPEFSSERISDLLEELHTPCLELFEASITDRLREQVLRQPRQPVSIG